MLFLQGSGDALAEETRLRGVVEGLGSRATLKVVDHADHAFHVPARSGKTDDQVRSELLDAAAEWIDRILGER